MGHYWHAVSNLKMDSKLTYWDFSRTRSSPSLGSVFSFQSIVFSFVLHDAWSLIIIDPALVDRRISFGDQASQRRVLGEPSRKQCIRLLSVWKGKMQQLSKYFKFLHWKGACFVFWLVMLFLQIIILSSEAIWYKLQTTDEEAAIKEGGMFTWRTISPGLLSPWLPEVHMTFSFFISCPHELGGVFSSHITWPLPFLLCPLTGHLYPTLPRSVISQPVPFLLCPPSCPPSECSACHHLPWVAPTPSPLNWDLEHS